MIRVVDYDPHWPAAFEEIEAQVWPAVGNVAIAIEHVGSTSVPGLPAKPIIDVDVVVAAGSVTAAVARLAVIGYTHQGDLGVPGREAFRHAFVVPHNLYVCVEGSVHLRNHLMLRNRLRTDASAAAEYAALKRRLAAQFPNDIDAYVVGKCELILRLLGDAGFSDAEIAAIRGVNR
jgi:GrpB-like predicted nucleotidyltransferase (UPF0157 family)